MFWAFILLASAADAPHRDWMGLELGASSADVVANWLTDHQLDCPATPSPRRTTTQYHCVADTDTADGLAGQRLLLARLDDGPLHHVSTIQDSADPEVAHAAYDNALAELTARYGTPTMAQPIQRMDAPMLRYRSAWSFDDLRVELSLTRFGGGPYQVHTRLDVPGAEDAAIARPGTTNPHGEAPKARQNPHITP